MRKARPTIVVGLNISNLKTEYTRLEVTWVYLFLESKTMTMLIREGTLEEAIQVVARVTEFAHGETVESMAERLGDKKV